MHALLSFFTICWINQKVFLVWPFSWEPVISQSHCTFSRNAKKCVIVILANNLLPFEPQARACQRYASVETLLWRIASRQCATALRTFGKLLGQFYRPYNVVFTTQIPITKGVSRAKTLTAVLYKCLWLVWIIYHSAHDKIYDLNTFIWNLLRIVRS